MYCSSQFPLVIFQSQRLLEEAFFVEGSLAPFPLRSLDFGKMTVALSNLTGAGMEGMPRGDLQLKRINGPAILHASKRLSKRLALYRSGAVQR